MKGKVFWVAICFVIIFVFCTTSISFAASDLWPKKEGELCWIAYNDDGDSVPDGLVRLYVMKTGNNHYLVHGYNTEPHPDYPKTGVDTTFTLANGNAIVNPDDPTEILINASSSAWDENEVRGWLGTVKLDIDTLNGIFQGVGINYYPLPSGTGYVTHDGPTILEYTTCP